MFDFILGYILGQVFLVLFMFFVGVIEISREE